MICPRPHLVPLAPTRVGIALCWISPAGYVQQSHQEPMDIKWFPVPACGGSTQPLTLSKTHIDLFEYEKDSVSSVQAAERQQLRWLCIWLSMSPWHRLSCPSERGERQVLSPWEKGHPDYCTILGEGVSRERRRADTHSPGPGHGGSDGVGALYASGEGPSSPCP